MFIILTFSLRIICKDCFFFSWSWETTLLHLQGHWGNDVVNHAGDVAIFTNLPILDSLAVCTAYIFQDLHIETYSK